MTRPPLLLIALLATPAQAIDYYAKYEGPAAVTRLVRQVEADHANRMARKLDHDARQVEKSDPMQAAKLRLLAQYIRDQKVETWFPPVVPESAPVPPVVSCDPETTLCPGTPLYEYLKKAGKIP